MTAAGATAQAGAGGAVTTHAPASPVAAGLSVVLPAFNEEANLAATVHAVLEVVGRLTSRFEIIVVDDGSADATAAVALGLAARHREIRLVRHEANRGYGAALRSGFASARLPWVFFTDADGQFDLRDIERLLPLAMHADIVAGYRSPRRDRWHRRVAGVVFGRWVVPWAIGVRARDLNCAFKLIRREVLERVALGSEGALINAELMARATAVGARMIEVGVSHRPRRAGVASGGTPRVAWRALRELRALRREIRSRVSPGRPADGR